MLSLFKNNTKEPELSPTDGRREHFFRVFDNEYGFMLSNNITSERYYNSVRNYYAQNQEILYQNMISLAEENDS
jgi:hypothetical protein